MLDLFLLVLLCGGYGLLAVLAARAVLLGHHRPDLQGVEPGGRPGSPDAGSGPRS